MKSPPSAVDPFARLADDGRARAERARQEWHAQHRPEPWAREKVTSAPPPPPPPYAVAIPPKPRGAAAAGAAHIERMRAARAPPPPGPPPPSPVPHEWRGGAGDALIAAVVKARDAAAAAMAPAAAPAVAVRDAAAVAPSPIGSKLREAEAAFEAQEAWWRDEEARKHAETAAWRAPAPAAAVGGPSSPPTFAHGARRRVPSVSTPPRTAPT